MPSLAPTKMTLFFPFTNAGYDEPPTRSQKLVSLIGLCRRQQVGADNVPEQLYTAPKLDAFLAAIATKII